MKTVMKKRYRTFIDCFGNWTDPLFDYEKSTTYHHDDNSHESDSKRAMVTEIKKAKYTFRESDLSEESKQEFKDRKIDDKLIKDEKTDISNDNSKSVKSK